MNDITGMTTQNIAVATDDDAIAIGTVITPAATSIKSSSGLAMNAATAATTTVRARRRKQTVSSILHFFRVFMTFLHDDVLHFSFVLAMEVMKLHISYNTVWME